MENAIFIAIGLILFFGICSIIIIIHDEFFGNEELTKEQTEEYVKPLLETPKIKTYNVLND